MDRLQQSNRTPVGLLLLVLVLAGCTPRHQPQARPVETAEQACQLASQHLASLGEDSSYYNVEVYPEHPISWDTVQSGNRYVPLPVQDSSAFGELVRTRLRGRLFWQCFAVDKGPATAATHLVTDAVRAQVYIEAGTGVVLLTSSQDLHRSTGSSQ
jgi:hypothetical protein